MSKKRRLRCNFLDALPEDGERRLMLAVLLDALRTLRRRPPSQQRRRPYRAWERTRLWLEAEDPSSPFSFVSICDALGLNPAYVRRNALSQARNRWSLGRPHQVGKRSAAGVH